jgi:3-oxoacyl-[acyl-carrier-protein] synthase II
MELSITGSAMVTSVGPDKTRSFEGFCAGASGRKPLQSFALPKFDVQLAYEIADRPGGVDRALRASELLVRAVLAAVDESGMDRSGTRWGVVVGTGLRELRSLELFWTQGMPLSIDQLHFEDALNRALDSAVPVVTLCNACAASSFALAVAEDCIAAGVFDSVVVAGCDILTESMFGLLDRVNPLHPDQVQPFDRDRKGVLMGDGAAAVVVESAAHAQQRGAAVLATVRGVGTSCDAYHETAPDVGGIVRAIRNACDRSAVLPADIDIVMAHGTGTGLNDRAEASALVAALGADAGKPQVSAIKSMTGHTSGASGLIGVVTAIEALRSGVVPPTVGLRQVMDEASTLNLVGGASAQAPGARVAQVNAFGFGGVNAVVIVESAA